MVNSVLQLIKVKDIKDDAYVLDSGSLRAVLAVPGINLSLLTEKEREIVIGQFKELLDGLDFPLQILIISRLANVENYLNFLNARLAKEEETLIRVQLEEYISFIKEYTDKHKIMKKIFYVVVPYDIMGLPGGGLLRREGSKKEEEYYQQLEQLETRVIYVSETLSGIGLQPIRLNNSELTQLLFEMYNPSIRWGSAPIQLFDELIEKVQ